MTGLESQGQSTGQAGLVLASASPRRAELLGGLGLDFQVRPANIPEDPLPGEEPAALVRRLSIAKGQAVARHMGREFVIGADSLVVFDGRAYGKPAGIAQARRMLQELRGTSHQVVTGLTVIDAGSGRSVTDSMSSGVVLRDILDSEIEESIESGTPFDKAGAYAIQDTELRPAEFWEGCYSNIVGLPLCRLAEILRDLGFPLPPLSLMQPLEGCTGACPFEATSKLEDLLGGNVG